MKEPIQSDEQAKPTDGGNQPAGETHADNYEPENAPNRNVPEDGPSGENTKNNGERGGGLWTSGGQVVTGSGINAGEFGKPQPDRQATPAKEDDESDAN